MLQHDVAPELDVVAAALEVADQPQQEVEVDPRGAALGAGLPAAPAPEIEGLVAADMGAPAPEAGQQRVEQRRHEARRGLDHRRTSVRSH